MKSSGTRIQTARRIAGTEKNLPLYLFENKKKKGTQMSGGITSSRGRVLVERSASRMSATPLANVSALLLRYAGTACIRNGEMRIAPRKSGRSQTRRFVLRTPVLLGKIDAKTAVTKVTITKITALREWVKNIEADKIVVVARNGNRENFSLCRNK